MGLNDIANKLRVTSGKWQGPLLKKLYERLQAMNVTDRRDDSDGWHASSIPYLCPRELALRSLFPKPASADDWDPRSLLRVDVGSAVHGWWQNQYLGPANILFGNWACRGKCQQRWKDCLMPARKCECGGRVEFTEIQMRDTDTGICGSTDGILMLDGDRWGFDLKCVDPDSLVVTDTGVHRAGDLVPTDVNSKGFAPVAFSVEGIDGPKSAVAGFRGWAARRLKVTTRFGFELIVTPEHPLRICGAAGFAWRRSDRLKVGDSILLKATGIPELRKPLEYVRPNTLPVNGYWRNSSRVWVEPGTRINTEKQVQVPETVEPWLGRLLGYWVGDGGLTHEHAVVFTAAREDVRRDYCGLVRKLGLEAVKRTGSKYDWVISSHGLQRVIRDGLGCALTLSKDKVVPKAVLTGGRECVIEFLRGYFECDSGVTRQGVTLTSASEKLIRQTHVLLSALGIFGMVRPVWVRRRKTDTSKTRYWYLQVGLEYLTKFKETIGFVSSEKQDRLEAVSAQKIVRSKLGFKLTETMRKVSERCKKEIPGLLKRLYSEYPASADWLQGRSRVSKSRLIKALPLLESALDGPEIDALRRLATDESVRADEIVSIEELPGGEVVDLTVPDGENFVSNGIVSHNTSHEDAMSRLKEPYESNVWQMNLYMHMLGLTKALIVYVDPVCRFWREKNGKELESLPVLEFRLDYDRKWWDKAVEVTKAAQKIKDEIKAGTFNGELPARICENPSIFRAKDCPSSQECFTMGIEAKAKELATAKK